MINKKTTIIVLLIALVIGVTIVVTNSSRDCLELKTGIVRVRVYHNNEFLVGHVLGLIQVNERSLSNPMRPAEKSPLITIDSFPFYQSVSEITKPSIDPGVKYATSSFNGYLADKGMHFPSGAEFYKIPFGNRIIQVIERTASLSDDRKKEAQEILSSIRISEGSEDVEKGEARVVECGWF